MIYVGVVCLGPHCSTAGVVPVAGCTSVGVAAGDKCSWSGSPLKFGIEAEVSSSSSAVRLPCQNDYVVRWGCVVWYGGSCHVVWCAACLVARHFFFLCSSATPRVQLTTHPLCVHAVRLNELPPSHVIQASRTCGAPGHPSV